MSLKLGSITTVVVSSPEAAKIVLQKHDLAFSSRTIPSAAAALNHEEFSMVWLPVENQWRKLRKICKEQMFSVARLDASQGVRREKLQKLSEYVKECSETGRAVDIGEAAFTTSLNLMSATLFSMDFAQFNSDTSQEMKDVVWGVMECIGSPNFADFFPDEKLKSGGGKDDLVEALIELSQRDDAELSRNDVKHLLLRRNQKLNRRKQPCPKDISRLPYLQAVVKKTFRLHPAAPFLVPHKAVSDIEINGYMVPKDAQILVNVWASGRDPYKWVESDAFVPERFLEHNMIDYRGKDFELIPFGAGRRICPGLPLAHRMVHLILATLIHNFGWELEIKSKEIDMNEKFGLTLQKAISLRAIPTKL
ncbi:UNVERIFIED_CONTAM: cytochrome [Sesamum calycinum]|uniref:Cytochrome n=1 Tax=Sesamum calycinum TaxID=2727403 RepID=A0AAW2T1Y9_9LAMI